MRSTFQTKPDGTPGCPSNFDQRRFAPLNCVRSGGLLVLLAALVVFFASGGAPPAYAQAPDDDTTTTIVDGGGGANGYEPTNVKVVPGDGELTVSWTVTSRPGVNDNDIKHALRWSQKSSWMDQPGRAPQERIL